MTDDWLQLIPVAATFVPDAAAAEDARRCLADLVGSADEVLSTVSETPVFIDSGANHERIGCPACGVDLDEGWWVRALDASGDAGFADLDVTVPCCRRRLSLDALVYEPTAGFARFVLEAMNPEDDSLTPEALDDLSKTLGTALRVVRTQV